MTLNKIVCTAGVCFLLKFSGVWPIKKIINSMSLYTTCSLVTYTVQLNPSLHVYFISDKIVLKCVKTHNSRILMSIFGNQRPDSQHFLKVELDSSKRNRTYLCVFM